MKTLQTLLATLAMASICSTAAHATSETWSGGGANNNWTTTADWNSGSGPAPGATVGSTTNTDTATFNTSTGATVTVDTGRNLQNITFDTNAGAFILTGGSLVLTTGGEIQIASTLAPSATTTETVNSNITIEGNYTFANNYAGATTTKLNIGGSITSGASSGTTTLSLTTAGAANSNTISGAISDGTNSIVALSASGSGTWIISGTNSFSGGTTISGGTLVLGASGGSTGTLGSGNVSIASGATLTFARALTTGYTYTFANNISGQGNVTKSGNGGFLYLTGSNSYSGATSITAGILNIQSSSALGSTSGVTVASGTTLQLQGGMTEGNVPLAIAGTGATTNGLSATGALENVSGANTYGGTVKLTAATTISSDAGTLVLSSTNTTTDAVFGSGAGGFGLTLTGSGNGSVAGIINGGTSGVAGAGTLTKSGSGTWSLGGANTFTGATTVAGGNLVLAGGTLAAGSAVTVGNNTSAAAILSGTGTVNGSLTTSTTTTNIAYLAPGVNTNTAGTFGSAGNLHVGGALTIGAGTALDFDLGTTATLGGNVNDLVIVGGVLTLNGTSGSPIVLNVSEIGGSLATGTAYTLISGASSVANSGSFSTADFFTTGDTGYSAVYSLSGTSLDVTFTATSAAAAYFNGVGNDMNTPGDFDGAATGNSANTTALSGTTNVFFSANRNASTTPNISAPLVVNSVNFGAGTGGAQTGITVSSTNTSDTLTIAATNANSNTAGNGITIATGGGSDTISAPVVLGASQTWTPTDASSTLTVSGQVSGSGFALTKAGLGAVVLSNPSGNTYTGGTVVNAGTLYVNSGVAGSTTSSGTGTGAITVNSGGTLAGSGNIVSSGVTIGAGGRLSSGPAQTAAPAVTAPGLTFTNTSVTVSGTGAGALSANLTFALGSGTDHLGVGTPGAGNFTNPITDTTYMTLSGSSTLNFTGTDSVSLVDLTAPTGNSGATLSLRLGTPYLLVAAGSNLAYTGLITVSGTGANAVYSIDGNGYVVGVLVAGSNYTGGSSAPVLNTQYTPIAINELAADGATPLSGTDIYPDPVLYLNAGDLEVVPEPGTWVMMLGGMAVLLFWQRNKGRLS